MLLSGLAAVLSTDITMLRTGVVLVVAVFVLLSVAPASSPVHLSYVYSDSMEPTLEEGDGYVLVPAGNVEPGEIITFYSTQRDTYVTHRVVAETTRGYITKGDNNPSTDQAGGLPPVDSEQIVGEVLTINGKPLVIPNLGALIRFIGNSQLALLAAGAVAVLAHAMHTRGASPRHRDVLRPRSLVLPALVGLALVSIVFVIAGASHTAIVYPVEETATGDPTVLTVGEQVTRTHRVYIASPRFSQIIVDVDGMTVAHRTLQRGHGPFVQQTTVNVTAQITPQTPGPHRGTISVYAYPPLLPRGLLELLHSIHPVVAATVSSLVVYGPLGLGYALLIDGTMPLRLPRNRSLRRYLER